MIGSIVFFYPHISEKMIVHSYIQEMTRERTWQFLSKLSTSSCLQSITARTSSYIVIYGHVIRNVAYLVR